jgi:hypothetical protein
MVSRYGLRHCDGGNFFNTVTFCSSTGLEWVLGRWSKSYSLSFVPVCISKDVGVSHDAFSVSVGIRVKAVFSSERVGWYV